MPPQLVRNQSLLAGVGVTFLYMGTFGALPYFLTILFQQVHGFSALDTGLGFIAPAVAIAAGTQAGERLTGRAGVRPALLIGFVLGGLGTAVLIPAFSASAHYLDALPGLIISGVGQGIVWTAMWIAAGVGVKPDQQGVANGMASTSLNLGYAIGLAVLVAVSGVGTTATTPAGFRDLLAHHAAHAILAVTGGLILGPLLVTIALPKQRNR